MDANTALLRIVEYANNIDKKLDEADKLEGWSAIFARTDALSEFFGYASTIAKASVVPKSTMEAKE